MPGSDLWNVVVPLPLRRAFVYAVPARLGHAEAGARVLVPFARRRLTGYLVSPCDGRGVQEHRIREVISLLDEGRPALPAQLLSFLLEAADYYLHPAGEVLRSALPPGIDPVETNGELKGPRITARLHTVVFPAPGAASALDELREKAPKRAAVLERVLEAGVLSTASLAAGDRNARAHLKRLVDDGLVGLRKEQRPVDPFFEGAVEKEDRPIPTAQQAAALARIDAAIEAGGYKGFLLHGITGSGKTEIYLRAVERAAAAGRGAMVLVPEIALTPQLVRRYRARFGDGLAVWHSALTDRERHEQWRALRAKEVKVCVGVRSAIFAPVADLGVVVVDEEHDGSFKQERGFPYNARDLALLRAARAGAVAVLGSATPSMETFHNATVGKLELLTLTARATAQPLPPIEIVDLARHRSGPGAQSVILAPLDAAIREALSRREQIILFLNRRGFAPSLLCRACGYVHRCDDCAVSLTLHRRPPALVCHYCGGRRPVPARCPQCGGADQAPVGAGTQKAEELLAALYPGARIARLDRDVVASGRAAQGVLDALRAGEIDILVGTQMVTKGHDFPRVTLVGVLLGDVGLHMPDFRAAERTFQLLTQVAGRAGRSALGGRAIIQTFSPAHPAVCAAAAHDYAAFLREELTARKELGYPPFGRLVAIRLSGKDGGKVESTARDLVSKLRDAARRLGTSDVDILGPVQAPIAVVQGRHRWRVLLRARRRDRVRALVTAVLDDIEKTPAGVAARIDVDPVSML